MPDTLLASHLFSLPYSFKICTDKSNDRSNIRYTIIMSKLPRTTVEYILKACIPYSEANLKLSFKPNLFFNDLEKISQRKRQTIRNSYYQVIKQGLVELDDQKLPKLTEKGIAKLRLYEPKKLKNAQLMVIFDIPERYRKKRQRLRTILRQFRFVQVQKSVWVSPYDCKEYLLLEIKQSDLEEHTILYEVVRL